MFHDCIVGDQRVQRSAFFGQSLAALYTHYPPTATNPETVSSASFLLSLSLSPRVHKRKLARPPRTGCPKKKKKNFWFFPLFLLNVVGRPDNVTGPIRFNVVWTVKRNFGKDYRRVGETFNERAGVTN